MLAAFVVHKRKRAHTCKNSCLGTCVWWFFVIVNIFDVSHAVGSGLKFCFAFVYNVFFCSAVVCVSAVHD